MADEETFSNVQPVEETFSNVTPIGPSNYSKLTAGYNPQVEEFAQSHPIIGPVVRFLDAAGGAALSTPEGIYNALRHPSDTAKGALESIAAWRNPNVRKGALSVLPEALGQGVGNVAGGEAMGAAVKPVSAAAASVVPSADTVGKVLRTETGALRPGVKTAAKAVGAGTGAMVGGGWGALVGEHLGTGLADSLIPAREATVAKAIPVSRNPRPEGYIGPASARKLASQAASTEAPPQSASTPTTSIVSPESSVAPIESEGRPATWTNQTVLTRSGQGDMTAIQQARLRGLTLPENANFVGNKAATVTPSVGARRLVMHFDANGNPIGPVPPTLPGGPADFANRMTLNPIGDTGARPLTADQFESSFGPEYQEVGDLAEWETGNREGVKPKKKVYH